MKLEEWYWLDVQDRTWKVAGMILPNILQEIGKIQGQANLAAGG
jgi:hypothetical protein